MIGNNSTKPECVFVDIAAVYLTSGLNKINTLSRNEQNKQFYKLPDQFFHKQTVENKDKRLRLIIKLS